MIPDVSAVDEVLLEHGLSFEDLDSSLPLTMLSSTASVTAGGAEAFRAAEQALRATDTQGCVLAIVVDYAAKDLGALGYPVHYDRSRGPVFGVHVVGREFTRSFPVCRDELSSLADLIGRTIDDIVADSDVIG